MALQDSILRLTTSVNTLIQSDRSMSSRMDVLEQTVMGSGNDLKKIKREIDELEASQKTLRTHVDQILSILSLQFSSLSVAFKDANGDDLDPILFAEGATLTATPSSVDPLGNAITLDDNNTKWFVQDATIVGLQQSMGVAKITGVKPGTTQVAIKVTVGQNTLTQTFDVTVSSNQAVAFVITLK